MTKIYLAGAMTGLTYEDANAWRKEFTCEMFDYSDGETFDLINPCNYAFPTDVSNAETDREAMEYDLHLLRHSDIVVANLGISTQSTGTISELAIAHELRIPVIGFNDKNVPLHPWTKMFCLKIFDNMDDLVSYLVDNFY